MEMRKASAQQSFVQLMAWIYPAYENPCEFSIWFIFAKLGA